MTSNLSISEKVKHFYNDIKFPGSYTEQQINNCNPVTHNLYLRFMSKFIKSGDTVADIGCGSGLVANVLAREHNCHITALDFADSIYIGKEFAANHGLKNVNWIKDDILNHAFETQFDVVICQGVLHHIPDYTQALAKIKSLVKPNGILLLGVYNPFGKVLKKITKLDYHSNILYRDQEHHPYETSFYAGEVIQMCQPMEFLEAAPGGNNKYACDVLSLFNSVNGGLTLYAFKDIND